MTALDAPTQPRSAHSEVHRGPAPPPRRPRVAAPATVRLDDRTEAPTRTPTRALPSPPSAPDATPPARRRRLPWLVGALAAGLATGAAVAAAGITITPARRSPDTAQVARVVRGLGTVRSTPQQLTTTFTVDNGFGLPGTSNSVTYRAVGTGYATVDLSQVRASDVHVTNGAVRVKLPTAQVPTPVVDENRSRVIRTDDGFLTRAFDNEVTASDLQDQATSHLGDEAQLEGLPAQAQFIAAADVRAALRRIGVTNPATLTTGS